MATKFILDLVRRAADRHIAEHGYRLTLGMRTAIQLEVRRRQMAHLGMTSASTEQHVIATVHGVVRLRDSRPRPRGAGRPRRRVCSRAVETRAGPDDDPAPPPAALSDGGRP